MLSKDTLSEVETILYELDVDIENNKQDYIDNYKKQLLLLFDALADQQNASGDNEQSIPFDQQNNVFSNGDVTRSNRQSLPASQNDTLVNQQGTHNAKQPGSHSALNTIGTIMFMLSRINIENDLLTYKIKTYGNKIYKDNHDFDFSFDVSDVMNYFKRAKENLTTNRKKYLGTIEPCNINAELNQYLPYFNMYAVNLLRDAFKDDEIQEALHKIKTFDDFFVIQSEIYEKPYLIYRNPA